MQITGSYPTMSTMMPGGLRRRGGPGFARMERTNPESGLSMRGLDGFLSGLGLVSDDETGLRRYLPLAGAAAGVGVRAYLLLRKRRR